MDRDVSSFGDFLHVAVELVSEGAHDPVCELSEPRCSEEHDDPCWEKEASDIGSETDPVKAEIAELDIWIELIEKGVARPVYGFSSRRPEVYLTG